MSAVVDDENNIALGSLSEAIGAELLCADLTAPLDDGAKSRLRGVLADFRLLLVRDEQISAPNQVDFAKIFGDIVIRQDYYV